MLTRVQKFFTLLMICAHSLYAMNYDNDILNMYAKLSPRIVLMSNTKDLLGETLQICLLYESTDEQSASILEQKILNNYKNGIREYRVEIKKVLYTKLDECAQSNMFFLFSTNETQIKKSVEFSKEKKVLTVSYDSKALESGVDVSLYIGRKVVPYLNVGSIQSKGIELESILFRISKVYKKEIKGDAK